MSGADERHPVAGTRRKALHNTVHMAGELFVAAELSKRGYQVSLTMGNAKAVDLFAERDGKVVCIQVKTLLKQAHAGWRIPFDMSKIIDGVIYVCVVLNRVGQAPHYYILKPQEVRDRAKRWPAKGRPDTGIADLPLAAAMDRRDAWHLIDKALIQLDRHKPKEAAITIVRTSDG
jgi:hypothetical protein